MPDDSHNTCAICGRSFAHARARVRTCSPPCTTALRARSNSKPHREETKRPLLERFLAKVVKRDNGCWEWTGIRASRRGGYGLIWVDGRAEKAHRVSLQLFGGPIPPGMHALHHCDNPPCVNPAHLFVGSHRDNVRDMYEKGRGHHFEPALGEKNNKAKLSNEQARSIKAAILAGERGRYIARRFCVSESLVCDIKRGKTWRHL